MWKYHPFEIIPYLYMKKGYFISYRHSCVPKTHYDSYICNGLSCLERTRPGYGTG